MYECSTYAVGYDWYNRQDSGLDEYLTREEDSTCTSHIFLAARNMPVKQEHYPINRLILMISEGGWTRVGELLGQPCEDCWLTERQYDLFFEMVESDIHAVGKVHFYIVPVDYEGTKIYKITLAYDTRNGDN